MILTRPEVIFGSHRSGRPSAAGEILIRTYLKLLFSFGSDTNAATDSPLPAGRSPAYKHEGSPLSGINRHGRRECRFCRSKNLPAFAAFAHPCALGEGVKFSNTKEVFSFPSSCPSPLRRRNFLYVMPPLRKQVSGFFQRLSDFGAGIAGSLNRFINRVIIHTAGFRNGVLR